MVSIGTTLVMGPATPYSDATVILYVTLGFSIVSLLCSIYTTLRTLLPLLGPHPLERRTTGSAVGPYNPAPSPKVEKKVRLKSAQRFTTYLAGLDIVAASILVWEAAVATSSGSALGSSRAGAARLTLACTARPTLLVMVAVLSYANVVQGRTISLGGCDHVVWLPAIFVVGLGSGLATLAIPGTTGLWWGLIAWLGSMALIVTLCFGRLLVAILRVRKESERERQRGTSQWAREQERVIHGSKAIHRGSRTSSIFRNINSPYLPPIHGNFSGLSTSFIGTVGRSNSTIDVSIYPATVDVPFQGPGVPALGYAPSRPSLDEDLNVRDFRSPTPGSSRGLLASMYNTLSRTPTPQTFYTSTPPRSNTPCPPPSGRADSEGDAHEILTFEELPRRSFSSNQTSVGGGGFVGGPAMREAIVKEVWAGAQVPGSGHGPAVELSQKEARSALVRIGGHLGGCILGFALVAPFLFIRLLRPSAYPPLVTSILLIFGVCQAGIILAVQCWLSEGFWFYSPIPPVLTSSSAADLERSTINGDGQSMRERAKSVASTIRHARSASTLPGIPTHGEDVEMPKGTFSRAMAMAAAHPKLLVLSDQASRPPAVASGANPSPRGTGHARLRSLTLTKNAFSTFASKQGKERRRSVASVRGFVHQFEELATLSPSSSPVLREDELVTRSLLLAHRASAVLEHRMAALASPRPRSPFDTFLRKKAPTSPDSPETHDFSFRTREFRLSSSSSESRTRGTARGRAEPDYTIDFLSSQVLPRLRPDIRVGSSTIVESEDAPPASHRRRPSAPIDSQSFQMSEFGRRPSRAHRNFSLPTLFQQTPASQDQSVLQADEPWVAIDDAEQPGPLSPIHSITQVVRGEAAEPRKRASSKNRSDDAWDRFEAQERSRRRPASIQVPNQPGRTGADAVVVSPPISLPPEFDESEAEVLTEERQFADSEGEDDEDIQEAVFQSYRARQSNSPTPSPAPDTTWSRDAEPVVLRGSRALADNTTAHVKIARPPSRTSSLGSVETTSGVNLRPIQHFANDSFTSTRSFASTADSITSAGFRNLLETNSWHARVDDPVTSTFSSSEERSSTEESRSRRPRAYDTARSSSGVLGGRDVNISSGSSASEGEDSDSRPRKPATRAHPGSQQQPRRSSTHIPIPPILDTIDEDLDEDKKSAAGSTPRAPGRARVLSTATVTVRAAAAGATGRQVNEAEPVTYSSITPPGITTRSRARQTALTRNDENSGAPTPKTPARPNGSEAQSSRTRVRGMR